jgi:hypothetical protein
MERNCIRQEYHSFKGSWIEFATDINHVMYAYIDRKKKLPVTTLCSEQSVLNGIKIFLEIFDLADEVKVSKAGLEKSLGRKLAARVLKTWHEDFVDEDTGEVVSIERNEIIFDRDTILEKEHIEEILELKCKPFLLHKEDVQSSDYAIITIPYKKTLPIRKKKRLNIFIVNCVMLNRQMRKQHAVLSTNYSLVSSATT